MKKILFMIMLVGFFSQMSKPLYAGDNSSLIGSWKSVVKDVPYQYGNSTITFNEIDKILTGVVKFDDGSEVKASSLKYENKKLVMTLYVEGSEVTVEGKVDGITITGTVTTPDNNKVAFTATKVVALKK